MVSAAGQDWEGVHSTLLPLTAFVGRRSEIEELKMMLAATRLLTLTGPAGRGKTRLAMELAAETRARFPDGVGFAGLTWLRDPAAIPEVVAAGLGWTERASARLAALVGGGRRLLVVDGAEGLLGAVSALVEELLRQCPCLSLLVTSREILDVDEGVSWRVPPLRLPPPADGPVRIRALAASDAVGLFLARAAERGAAVELTHDNARLVDALCRRLDGLPLALELAAAWLPQLSLSEIVAGLDDRLGPPARHPRPAGVRRRTLQAALAWSYELLDEPERRLLRRLAAFAGTFDLAAAEAVCAGPDLPAGDVAHRLGRLAERSLVVAHSPPHGGLRYLLTAAVAQYGRERLIEAGESEVGARHACHFASALERLGGDAPVSAATGRVAADYDNVRWALDWAAARDPCLEAVLVRRLDWFWRLRGLHREAYARIVSVLGRAPLSAALRAALCSDAAVHAAQLGNPRTALALADEAVRLLDDLDEGALAVGVLSRRGVLRAASGRLEAAEEDLARAVRASRGLRPSIEAATAMNNLGLLAVESGRPLDGLLEVDRALAMLADTTDRLRARARFLHTKGAALLALGRVAEARRWLLTGLEEAAEHDDHEAGVALLQALACAAAMTGRASCCLELLAAARSCGRMIGVEEPRSPATPSDEAERSSRRTLAERPAAQAWATGLRLDLRGALHRARSQGRPEGGSPLTPRKAEVVRLVTEGLSNKEIARRLLVSERTVEAHLEQVRRRLGFNNRAQVAAWAVANGLASA